MSIITYLIILPIIPYDTIDIIINASIIPINIASADFFMSILKTDDTRAPVQAPVPGRGMPTNNTNPQKPYLSILDLFLCARFLKNFTSFFVGSHFSIKSKILFKNSKINGIGKIFPTIHITAAFIYGIFKIEAAISPPLNSSNGIREIINTIISLEIVFPNSFIMFIIILFNTAILLTQIYIKHININC